MFLSVRGSVRCASTVALRRRGWLRRRQRVQRRHVDGGGRRGPVRRRFAPVGAERPPGGVSLVGGGLLLLELWRGGVAGLGGAGGGGGHVRRRLQVVAPLHQQTLFPVVVALLPHAAALVPRPLQLGLQAADLRLLLVPLLQPLGTTILRVAPVLERATLLLQPDDLGARKSVQPLVELADRQRHQHVVGEEGVGRAGRVDDAVAARDAGAAAVRRQTEGPTTVAHGLAHAQGRVGRVVQVAGVFSAEAVHGATCAHVLRPDLHGQRVVAAAQVQGTFGVAVAQVGGRGSPAVAVRLQHVDAHVADVVVSVLLVVEAVGHEGRRRRQRTVVAVVLRRRRRVGRRARRRRRHRREHARLTFVRLQKHVLRRRRRRLLRLREQLVQLRRRRRRQGAHAVQLVVGAGGGGAAVRLHQHLLRRWRRRRAVRVQHHRSRVGLEGVRAALARLALHLAQVIEVEFVHVLSVVVYQGCGVHGSTQASMRALAAVSAAFLRHLLSLLAARGAQVAASAVAPEEAGSQRRRRLPAPPPLARPYQSRYNAHNNYRRRLLSKLQIGVTPPPQYGRCELQSPVYLAPAAAARRASSHANLFSA